MSATSVRFRAGWIGNAPRVYIDGVGVGVGGVGDVVGGGGGAGVGAG